VLESARGGLLRAGLGFKRCDVGIVTNVAPDHLGLKGIHTLEQLARVKGVIPETVLPDGYAILNADDDRVYEMRTSVKCNVALFSMDENNPRVKDHMRKGGLSALYENGYITLAKGEWKMRITKAVNVPLTIDGKAAFMIQNVLPAVITGYVRGLSIEDIKVALESFIPSPSQTPGRLNIFEFKHFKIMLDYAHNPAGLRALAKLVEKMEGSPKVGIVAGIGDRRDEDNRELGAIAAEMFDHVIIRQDRNPLTLSCPQTLIQHGSRTAPINVRQHDMGDGLHRLSHHTLNRPTQQFPPSRDRRGYHRHRNHTRRILFQISHTTDPIPLPTITVPPSKCFVDSSKRK
jgi:cyanophycin synthetase